MPGTHAVFVYGMLLREATEPATVHGWRLAFDGHATIEPREGEHVRGGLMHVTDDGLRHLDYIEGEGSYYDRVRIEVHTGGGPSVAWVYIMRRTRQGHFSIDPAPHYVGMIERGYERFGYDATPLHEAAQRMRYVSRA